MDLKSFAAAFRLGWGRQIHQRDSTGEQMRSRWRVHVLPTLGRFWLEELTRARIQWAVGEWSSTLATTTVEVVFSYLTIALAAAAADRLIRRTGAAG